MYLNGVGPARADALRRLGIFTARDLLHPHSAPVRGREHRLADRDARVGDDATVIGTVISKGVIPTRKGLRVFQAVVQDASGLIEASWPGQPFLDRAIKKGDVLLLTGPVRFFHGRVLAPREFVNLGPEDRQRDGGGRVLVGVSRDGGILVQAAARADRGAPRRIPAAVQGVPPDRHPAFRGRAVAPRRAARGASAAHARRGARGARAPRVRGTALRAPAAAAREGARARGARRDPVREQARAHLEAQVAAPVRAHAARRCGPRARS